MIRFWMKKKAIFWYSFLWKTSQIKTLKILNHNSTYSLSRRRKKYYSEYKNISTLHPFKYLLLNKIKRIFCLEWIFAWVHLSSILALSYRKCCETITKTSLLMYCLFVRNSLSYQNKFKKTLRKSRFIENAYLYKM